MPRDANGNYTLPSGNPVVTQTDIASTWANDTMADIGSEMTDSLSRSGKGGMTGPFPIIDKQGNVPGLSFTAEPTSGLEREAAGDVRLQVQGTDKMRWTASQDAEVWRDSAWQLVATTPSGQKAMTGVGGTTAVYMYNATVPPLDWTLLEPDANIRNLTIGGTGATIGGAENPTDNTYNISVNLPSNTGSHTLTEAQMPAHVHPEKAAPDVGDGTIRVGSISTTGTNVTVNSNTDFTGGGQGHTHPLGGSANGTLRLQPRHAMGLLAQLNA